LPRTKRRSAVPEVFEMWQTRISGRSVGSWKKNSVALLLPLAALAGFAPSLRLPLVLRSLQRIVIAYVTPNRLGRVTAERELHDRLERLRGSEPFRHYARVRAEVLRMKTAEAERDESRPSAYWREELANVEYLLDASPLVIERLRHHTYHVTGIRPYDYRSGADERGELLAEKLVALRELGGDALLVPEPELLGGFGFEIDGALFNIDTLKFYEALIALERGGLLAQFRGPADRPIVLEIGSGWGGMAYQFKTLFPETCYVLVDLPELFLFSGVYLLSAFPQARVAFWDDRSPLEPDALAEHDFVFLPHTSFAGIAAARVGLALNMVSFQEMTTQQVQGYVEGLFALGCPALYSLNRDRSSYNRELTNVREIIGTRYELDEIEVLPVPYTKLVSRAEIAERRAREDRRGRKSSTSDYRHVIGRLRRASPEAGAPAAGAPTSGRRHRIRAALRRR
jgi:hypothetical protein